MQIRDAYAGDVDKLCDYIVWGQGLHVEADPDIFVPLDKDVVKPFLQRCLDSEISSIRVAVEGEAIVGFFFAEIHERKRSFLRLPRRFLCLELLAVDPEHQRTGVGSALLADALKLAESKDVHRVELEVMGSNHIARRFYASRGFSELQCRMYRDDGAG